MLQTDVLIHDRRTGIRSRILGSWPKDLWIPQRRLKKTRLCKLLRDANLNQPANVWYLFKDHWKLVKGQQARWTSPVISGTP